MKAADLTVDELRALIRKIVHKELQAIMADPDQYLELTDEIQARIESSLKTSDRIPLQGVKDRLKLVELSHPISCDPEQPLGQKDHHAAK